MLIGAVLEFVGVFVEEFRVTYLFVSSLGRGGCCYTKVV